MAIRCKIHKVTIMAVVSLKVATVAIVLTNGQLIYLKHP